jgi:hypothetical protein
MIMGGVDRTNIDTVLWLYLGAISQRHREWTGHPMVITSLRRPPGPRPSLHSPPDGIPCRAADIRRWLLNDSDQAANFARRLQTDFGLELGVVLEPEWLTPEQVAERGGMSKIAGHLHVELKAQAHGALV